MKYNGLTSDEVKELMKQGKTNYVKRQSNQTYLSIFVKNIFLLKGKKIEKKK